METADTRNNATEEVGAVSMSPSTSLLAEAGSPCCLYYEMPYCVEYFGNGRWQRDSNWAEEEIADALSRVEEIKTQKWAKDARLIRMRFEIITVNVNALHFLKPRAVSEICEQRLVGLSQLPVLL
jgi:hypothetical protein